MSEVTYLSEFRDRRDSAMQRRPGESLADLMRRARSKATHPSAAPPLTDCPWLSVDEVHHWTQNNTAFEQLRRAYLNHITSRPERIHWSLATPERRAEVGRALRILRGTDHGSDDGNAEGHRADPGLPRG